MNLWHVFQEAIMLKRSDVARTLTGAIMGALTALLMTWTVSLPAQEATPLFHPPQAQMAWTSIGAVGAPDEGDAGLLRFGSNGAAAIADGLRYPVQAMLRYNILPVLGLYPVVEVAGSQVPLCLTVGYRDNGPDARVIVTVKRIDVGPARLLTLARFDSDFTPDGAPRPPTGNVFEEGAVCPMSSSTFAGMNDSSFFIEAQLIRTATAGNPGLQALTIELDKE
jgi:hypothetical protein